MNYNKKALINCLTFHPQFTKLVSSAFRWTLCSGFGSNPTTQTSSLFLEKKTRSCGSLMQSCQLMVNCTLNSIQNSLTHCKIRVVLLVTLGDSASCFIQLQMIWEKTSFGWKILLVQNILIVPICQKRTFKKIPFHDFFIIFIVVTHRDFFYHFLCCSNKYCFFLVLFECFLAIWLLMVVNQ